MCRSSLSLLTFLILPLFFVGCQSQPALRLSDIDADLSNGQLIYEDDCILCHEGAIEGAHRLDQSDRWRESAKKGYERLVSNTIQGYRGKYGELPVMGMCPQCSESDIRDAVAYMLVSAGVMK